MKSVRKAFKRRIQSRYNLRSRKPLTTTVRTSTPKVSSYVQVDLSEEESCELFQELPFCVVPPHASEENYSEFHTQEPRRISTAYSSQNLADCTNREPIDISIDSREEPSIVRPSSPRPQKHSPVDLLNSAIFISATGRRHIANCPSRKNVEATIRYKFKYPEVHRFRTKRSSCDRAVTPENRSPERRVHYDQARSSVRGRNYQEVRGSK